MNDWDDACDEAFLKAKESLIKIVMLIYPNPTLEYKIYADASGDALGGMLAQTYEVQGKDVDLPIGFTSYTFSKVEQCYATITKEAFAIFHCFKKWYTIIDYCPVHIMMDARSLTLFLRGRTHNNMLDQMSLMIAPYQPKITWLKGMDNKISDMISRMPMVTNDTKLIPRHDWLEVKNGDLPNILESCNTPQKEILCKSMGLLEETPSDGKIRLNVVDPPSERGPETRLQKKMRLLRQNQEEMDSETYAKELTSEQYDRIMNPIKDSVLKEAQDSDPFCQGIRQLMKEKKTKSERYLLVNGIIHKIIVHEGIIHSPILVPESLQK